ncbi:helix-turn-helix transcriptional regulator [Sulfitobacter sp. TSTF-M16]|uniref:Helix-turn-helix transcriptional regulator n=1 Tax=Sulfitobacter aestuariivivens TaxID=2766981 RepID=A0A927D487_9RHOB|nr:AraC family transcriptional regulator [Sulfitobacter aestuariivivens]MBD3663107.1 helix-turn-helix transcriptional regulator [Sulfitobacter aestuariivivens]
MAHGYLTDIKVQTLSQLSGGHSWQISLLHGRPGHTLIWTTRGQGKVHLDGQRRGLGPHNAIWIPAGHLFALEPGYQCTGLAVSIPEGMDLRLPQMARQLRIREASVQTELTSIIEAAQREEQAGRPLQQDALEAHAALISVWLRRQIILEEHLPPKQNAGARLSAAFCDLVAERYASGATMAEFADLLGVTPTHLSRAVKATTGKTAADVLSERILHAARTLLRETDETAQDIARHLGFGSAAYFTRYMQQHTGSPPSKLRR